MFNFNTSRTNYSSFELFIFHTCSWCFVFVISNFVWLIYIKNMKLTSKRSKFNYIFNWKFNSNVLISIQGVPVFESAPRFSKFTFHLIKRVAVTQTRTCRFSWFSGGLCESDILNFFLIFVLQCNIVILRSLHRHGEYWRPRSQSDYRYFGSYMISTDGLL